MSRHKEKHEVEGVITSDAVHQRPKRGKKVLLFGVMAVLVVVALGAWTAYALWQKPGDKKASSTVSLSPANPAADPAKTLASAQAQLSKAQTTSEKAAAYSNLGAAYATDNQPSQAISAYQNAVNLDRGSDVNTLAALASAYQANNQTSQAISTFQKIVTALQQSKDPTLQAQATAYQGLIQQLQSGKASQ